MLLFPNSIIFYVSISPFDFEHTLDCSRLRPTNRQALLGDNYEEVQKLGLSISIKNIFTVL